MWRAGRTLGTKESDFGLPEPVAALLVAVDKLATAPVVQSWLSGPPRTDGTTGLEAALQAAGGRVKSEGARTSETKRYTVEETWALLLARDLVALPNHQPGLGQVLAQSEFDQIDESVRHIDATWHHEFHHAARRVDHVPPELADLRAQVPRA
jgi:hypothetical protein